MSRALPVLLCGVVLGLGAGSSSAAAAASRPIVVRVDTSHQRPAVPATFLGLSFEVAALGRVAHFGAVGNLVGLLRSLGPGVLRFGGVSADSQVAWSDVQTPKPAWARSVIDERQLRELGRLATRSGWRILLTIGFGHFEPGAAAREAGAASSALGRSLEAIELGNEPNAYAQHGLRAEPWTVGQYGEEVAAYRAAIGSVAPGLALAGPDVSGSSAFATWGLEELVNQAPSLLTGHHYPLGCAQQPPPSIPRLLSAPIRAQERVSLRRYLSLGKATETPFRLDEANTVSCGGTAGISDTFASALWAVDYIVRAMSMGAAGINLEGNPSNCLSYTPVCAADPAALDEGRLIAQPEWYALLMTRSLLGDRPLGATASARGHPEIDATHFLASDGSLHSVLVDDEPPGSPTASIALRVGRRFKGGSLLELTAPSLESVGDVTLGRAPVAADGSWRASGPLPRVANRKGTVRVPLAAGSAVLVTLARAHPHKGG